MKIYKIMNTTSMKTQSQLIEITIITIILTK